MLNESNCSGGGGLDGVASQLALTYGGAPDVEPAVFDAALDKRLCTTPAKLMLFYPCYGFMDRYELAPLDVLEADLRMQVVQKSGVE